MAFSLVDSRRGNRLCSRQASDPQESSRSNIWIALIEDSTGVTSEEAGTTLTDIVPGALTGLGRKLDQPSEGPCLSHTNIE